MTDEELKNHKLQTSVGCIIGAIGVLHILRISIGRTDCAPETKRFGDFMESIIKEFVQDLQREMDTEDCSAESCARSVAEFIRHHTSPNEDDASEWQ